MKNPRPRRARQKGTTVVEAAFVLPVFLLFLFFLFAFGHARMIDALLQAACRTAVRQGANEGVTTGAIEAQMKQILGAGVDPEKVTLMIKDASAMESGTLPETAEDYAQMPDLELAEAERRQLFLVRASVPYNSIALLALPWTEDLVLAGQAISRHE